MPFKVKSKHNSRRRENRENLLVLDPPRNSDGTLKRENPKRWEKCRDSLRSFCLEYMNPVFCWDFGPAHEIAIAKAERAVIEGGLFALAMPRGSGKTCICEAAAAWAILYGYRKYVMLIAATQPKSTALVDDLKTFFMQSAEIHEDFPEVKAFTTMPNLSHRCRNLLLPDKKNACVIWRSDRVVFPAIEGAGCAAAVLEATGLTSDIRGRKFTRPNGQIVRPDLALIDDPQTLESAGSLTQTEDREQIIRKDILGLAGPGCKISVLMPCTVIDNNDLAERMLDKEKNPDWQGERTAMFISFPKNLKLWDQYNEVRIEGIKRGDIGKSANAFYREHKRELEKGAEVSWEARKNDGDISAIQTAMNLYFKVGKEAFFSEYQNQPIKKDVSLTAVTPEIICNRSNGLKSGVVRPESAFVTGFADINRVGFHWAVMAFRPDFTGDVVQYGCWPGGGEPLWNEGEEDEAKALYARLFQFVPWLTEQLPLVKEGQSTRLDWLSIDCGWHTATVIRALEEMVRTVPCPVRPSRGYSSRHYRSPPKDRLIAGGENWDLRKFGTAPVLAHNADVYKHQMQKSWMLPPGSPGGLSVFGNIADGKQHQILGEHICANQLKRFIKGDEGRYDIYDWAQTGHDDLGDAVVGCMVAAARLGVVRSGTIQRPATRARKGNKVRVHYENV